MKVQKEQNYNAVQFNTR